MNPRKKLIPKATTNPSKKSKVVKTVDEDSLSDPELSVNTTDSSTATTVRQSKKAVTRTSKAVKVDKK